MRIVVKCRECGRELDYEYGKKYSDPMSAISALLAIERQEIMGAIVNSQWTPQEFRVQVKAFPHELPKDIQAVSQARRCDCGCTFLYLARDFYITENS
jgi:hypothetical protein